MVIKMGITMEQNVQRRREYVEKVRSSFEKNDTARMEESEETSFSFAKLSFLIALILFGAFYLWQESGEEWYGYQPADVVAMIEENLFDTNLLDYVMIKK